MAGDAQDARARVARGADLRVGLAAHVDNVPNVAEGLDVVDDRRALVEAEDRGEIRGLDAGIGALALERLDEAGLLAAYVGAGAAVDEDVAAVAGAQDVRADKIGGTGLGDRALEDAGALGELAADVDVGLLHVVGEAADHDPLDHLVGILVDDVAVLEGARLRLVRVDDQVDGLAALPVHERPLDAAGEPSAAAAAKARLLDLVDQFLGLATHGLAQHLVPPVPHVAREVVGVAGLVNVLENQAMLLGRGHGSRETCLSVRPPRP